MKKVVTAMLVLFTLFWVSGVSADRESGKRSPESMLVCGSGNGAGISSRSLPGTINAEFCEPFGDSHCAACLISLEQ